MRDPDRLNKFYAEFREIHKKSFADWRFGQLCSNFFGWLYQKKGVDLFFPEEDEMIKYLKEFTNDTSPYHQEWEIDGIKL